MFLLFDWLQLQIALESRFVCVLGNKVPAIIRRRVEHLHLLPHGDFAVIVDGSELHNMIAHDLLRQCIADDIQIKGVVDVVVQVAVSFQ